jgi:hypothetical protein
MLLHSNSTRIIETEAQLLRLPVLIAIILLSYVNSVNSDSHDLAFMKQGNAGDHFNAVYPESL